MNNDNFKNHLGNGNSFENVSVRQFIIAIIVMIAIFFLVSQFFRLMYFNSALQDFNSIRDTVQKEQQQISEAIETKRQDLEAQMSPLLSKNDQVRIRTDERRELDAVHRERTTSKVEQRIDNEYNFVLDVLQGKAESKNTPFDRYLDALYEYCSRCHNYLEADIFRFRSNIIAKNNLAAKYKKDVALLESLSRLDDWDKQTLIAKKQYIEDAKHYRLDMTDAEIAQYVLKDNPDTVIASCTRRASKAIPILVKYSDGEILARYLDRIKKTAEVFGIAKDVDWTVPYMVKHEKVEFHEHMVKWCRERPGVCRYSMNSPNPANEKLVKQEKMRYAKMMNERYASLGDNVGLEYAVFKKYRHRIYPNDLLEEVSNQK
ncbi:hypothetical protein EDM53_01505 [Rickettsiales endosymbiont of Peranema trichophorum]|uniref:hypothetical protein n=1 Tax=Rickettsiales endosymbiont of Peranema trichophorum TaxID=2486577 RepID=UPI001022E182|nr:hypothetical protein [Rickettsiales endosymbiont of Peranema trichophorum]RZI47514.1 hypothetical protein EDM53_01505 [Rickettsiales endosymbiont of Peranema trichophorum]